MRNEPGLPDRGGMGCPSVSWTRMTASAATASSKTLLLARACGVRAGQPPCVPRYDLPGQPVPPL
eukprot:9676306-Lingulodinium_polyedra.AAC.1